MAWLTIHWGILPRLEHATPWIEQRASAALGQPVRIGAIRARSDRWIPSLELENVRLLDAQGRTVLELGKVQAALAARALLAMQLRFAHLHVDGVQLDVRRGRDGRIRVAGLDAQAQGPATDDGRAADWLFEQGEIVVRRGLVRWTDELRNAPPLALTDVDLVLRNGLRRHQVRLDATPPAHWGERFTLIGQFRQPLLERRGRWQAWSGTLHVQLPAADVGQLRSYVGLPFDLDRGRGALRAWLDLDEGRLSGGAADLALADVSARLASHLQPIALATMGGRVTAKVGPRGVELRTQRLELKTAEGLEWRGGDLALEWQQAGPFEEAAQRGPVTGGRLRADRLDLDVIGSLASRLPLGRAAERTLQSLSPGGVVTGLDLRWSGAPDAPDRYQARGRVARLVLAPQPAQQVQAIGRPGLAGADIEFELNESGGRASLAMQQGALHFPGIFEDPAIPMARFDARLDWRVERRADAPTAVELRVSDARFANDDAEGELNAVWRTGKRPGFGPGAQLPGEIDLSGRIVRARAERVAAYLPTGIPVAARRYVQRAVRGGQIDNGSFVVKGDAWQFPFIDGRSGTFRIAGRLDNAQFDYLPSVPPGGDEPVWASPWPGFTQVSGELLFDRDTMTLDRLQARMWGVQLRDVRARIDRLSSDEPLLLVQGDGRGPLVDLLRFVDVSPVGQWIGGGLKPLSASGAGDLRLELGIPLNHPDRTSVKGSVTVAGNDVQIRPDLPLLGGARGRVEFTHDGFRIVGATARALGGELAFDGGSLPDGSLRFQAQGTATAEGLRRTREFEALSAVAQALRGQASWRAQIAITRGLPEVTVTSDLVGLHSDWPAPLDKAAATPLAMRWQSVVQQAEGATPEALRDQLRLDLGSLLQLRLNRDGDRGAADGAMRIVGGSIGLNDQAPAVLPGMLSVRGRLARLDAEAWLRATAGPGDGAGALPALPRLQAAVRVDELAVAARHITGAQLDLRQESGAGAGAWQLQVAADQLAGRLHWRPPRSPSDPGRLTARLERLDLAPASPAAQAASVEPLAAEGRSRWPALDIAVDELELRGRKLGRLALVAAGRGGSVSRDWTLERLELEMPGATLSGSGLWTEAARPGAADRMSLQFTLDLQDSGRLASRFGWDDAVRGGSGRIKGQLGWSGSPLSPQWSSMDGQLSIALARGQFLRAEPGGVGRLLGILSLQSLPRRLLLDFRDVVQQGFAFDEVSGDVQVAQGKARTDNLRMRGVQATVFIAGTADLLRETQDLHVLIVPELNVGTASLAYLAVNPAVGLGTIVAQLLLRDPLRAASTREFTIRGPMGDPKVERIERSVPAAVPASGAVPAPEPGPAGPAPAPAPSPTERAG